MMRTLALTVAVAMLLQAPRPAATQSAGGAACPVCAWKPPTGKRVVDASNVDRLERAIAEAKPGDTIRIADGTYDLRRTLEISVPNVTLLGRSGDPARVILQGRGMTNDEVGVAIAIGATDVTIADITVRRVGQHAIQVRGERGASRFVLHNARLGDAGQQILKGSLSIGSTVYADDGLVACSQFAYTVSAPSDYTDGIDLIGASGWTIRDNRFERIRGPESGGWSGGPAILLWGASEKTLVERNLIVDSFRGIALGLAPGGTPYARNGVKDYDHLGGVMRHNVVVNLNGWADEALEANGTRDARIEYNTVLVEGTAGWSIGVRFPGATALVRNNLTNRAILERNGGRATAQGNIFDAARTWFVNPAGADLHLSPVAVRAIDAGVAIPGVDLDFDRHPRLVGRSPDVGAFEAPARGSGRR